MTISLSKTYFVACTLCFVTLFTLSKVFFCSVCIALFSRSREDQISKLSSLHLNFYNLSRFCSLWTFLVLIYLFRSCFSDHFTLDLWISKKKRKNNVVLLIYVFGVLWVFSEYILQVFSEYCLYMCQQTYIQ